MNSKSFTVRVDQIKLNRNFTIQSSTITVAPIKALCNEITADWKSKFEQLGLLCGSVTGDDNDFDLNISKFSIIVTTPEKFDSLSRKWNACDYMNDIKLLMIDEVNVSISIIEFVTKITFTFSQPLKRVMSCHVDRLNECNEIFCYGVSDGRAIDGRKKTVFGVDVFFALLYLSSLHKLGLISNLTAIQFPQHFIKLWNRFARLTTLTSRLLLARLPDKFYFLKQIFSIPLGSFTQRRQTRTDSGSSCLTDENNETEIESAQCINRSNQICCCFRNHSKYH